MWRLAGAWRPGRWGWSLAVAVFALGGMAFGGASRGKAPAAADSALAGMRALPPEPYIPPNVPETPSEVAMDASYNAAEIANYHPVSPFSGTGPSASINEVKRDLRRDRNAENTIYTGHTLPHEWKRSLAFAFTPAALRNEVSVVVNNLRYGDSPSSGCSRLPLVIASQGILVVGRRALALTEEKGWCVRDGHAKLLYQREHDQYALERQGRHWKIVAWIRRDKPAG